LLYLAQYGNNSSLAKAEVLSYVLTNRFSFVSEDTNYLIFNSETNVRPDFGSVLRVAKFFAYEHNLLSAIKEELCFTDRAILWSIFPANIHGEDVKRIRHEIMSLLKVIRKKSIYVSPDQNYSDNGGVTVTKALRKLSHGGFELLVSKQAGELTYWKVIKYIDLNGFRERDLQRPYQNSMLSLPISLARTMVNLSCAKPGNTLLDPFCGTGTILIEAAESGISVTGVDVDPIKVEGARRNLEWLFHIKKGSVFYVFKHDARSVHEKFPSEFFDCVVTEPPFGPPLKSLPTLALSQEIAYSLTALYRNFFLSVSKVLKVGGKVVVTMPLWRLQDGGSYSLPVKQLLKATSLSLDETLSGYGVSYPITWSKPDNKIQRQIFVLTKRAS
jgi:tRNA G10  N-methylase Trm11